MAEVTVDLKKYFTDSELNKMSAYERLRKKNEVEKFLKIQGIGGMTIPEPDFMKKKAPLAKQIEKEEDKKKPQKRARKDDEDEDWIPENHFQMKVERKVLRNSNAVPLGDNSQSAGTTSYKASDRYPKRENKTTPNYKEADSPDSDDFIFCDECDREWDGDCKEHPLQIIHDNPVPMDKADDKRAIKTTPKELSVNTSHIPKAGLGVWARQVIPYRTMFGPYEGTKVRLNISTGYGWQIYKNGKADHCVDASEAGVSNWMRYVNCARHKDEQNLFPFQYKGQVFYRTTRQIAPLQELLVYYGDSYAQDLGIKRKEFKAEKTEPLEKLTFDCAGCNLAFTSPVYLERHQRRRNCGVGNSNPRSQQMEKTTTTGENSLQTCTTNTNLNTHLRVHTNERSYSCTQSPKTFTTNFNLNTHLRVHTNERPYSCTHCPKTFSHNSSLFTHLRVHTNERPYSCTHCPKTFTTNTNLNIHLRVHTNERPYSCTHCPKTFTTNTNLNIHLRVHTNERPYSCTHCPKTFSYNSSLFTHLRVHTNERPYSCTHCPKTFSHNSSFHRHLRVHTNERPYSCTHCPKTFTTNTNLNIHLRVHTNERPYSCTHCPKTFTQYGNLCTHLRKFHLVDDPKM